MSLFGSIFGSKRQHELEMARVQLRMQRSEDRKDAKMYAYANGVQPSNGFASVMQNSGWVGSAVANSINPAGGAFSSLFGGGAPGARGAPDQSSMLLIGGGLLLFIMLLTGGKK